LRSGIHIRMILQLDVHRTLSLVLHNLCINLNFEIYYGGTCKRFLSITEVAVIYSRYLKQHKLTEGMKLHRETCGRLYEHS